MSTTDWVLIAAAAALLWWKFKPAQGPGNGITTPGVRMTGTDGPQPNQRAMATTPGVIDPGRGSGITTPGIVRTVRQGGPGDTRRTPTSTTATVTSGGSSSSRATAAPVKVPDPARPTTPGFVVRPATPTERTTGFVTPPVAGNYTNPTSGGPGKPRLAPSYGAS